MSIDIEYLERKYFVKDLPIPYNTYTYDAEFKSKVTSYKNILEVLEKQVVANPNGHISGIQEQTLELLKQEIINHTTQLYLYPPTMNDYDSFNYCIDCFTMDVNDDIDGSNVEEMVELLSMNYLDYMIWKNKKEKGKNIFKKMQGLLTLIFKIEIKTIDVIYENSKPTLFVNASEAKDKDINFYLTNRDLEDLKNIVCHQSIKDYNGGYISKDIQNELKTMNEIKGNRYEPVTLERKISAVSVLSHISEEELWNMSIRRFQLKEEFSFDVLQWAVSSLVEGMGHFTFKKPIEHFLFKTKKTGIDGFVPYQTMADKFK